MRTAIAHALSLIGHPVLVMPIASGLSVWAGGGALSETRMVLTVAAPIAAAVLIYSLVQVARKKWTDADASAPEERSQLNFILAPLLLGAAAWAWWSGQPMPVTVGLALAAGIAGFALVLSRWLKLSLHVAFSVYAACLFWPDMRFVAAGLGFAALIGWARLHLKRHTFADVVAGACAGLTAGILLYLLSGSP